MNARNYCALQHEGCLSLKKWHSGILLRRQVRKNLFALIPGRGVSRDRILLRNLLE